MNDRTLANKYRPKKFSEVVGQQSEVDVLKKIVESVLMPPVVLFCGPWGTGKTSMARLLARALFCSNRQGLEPCGECPSCRAMDNESHPGYTELDAATRGLVDDVRELKNMLEFRTTGELRIIALDECHMMKDSAQNALLRMFEEGQQGVLWALCTTEARKMLPTIRSRCIECSLKLLTSKQIADRLREVVGMEGKTGIVEDKALRIVATYVRGHLRDALLLTQQLLSMGGTVTEQLARTYLRLDQWIPAYEFLTIRDKKEQFVKLEEMLCSYSAHELQEVLGQALLDAYKITMQIGEFGEVDAAWLGKIAQAHGDTLLKKAERVLSLEVDFATINHAMASFSRIFVDENVMQVGGGEDRGLMPQFRKPGKE